jgi:hypothetical protein
MRAHHPERMSNRKFVSAAPSLLGARSASAQNAVLKPSRSTWRNALVPGASAVLKNTATGVTTESVSNAQGLVSFRRRPRPYELTGHPRITPSPSEDRLEVGESRA